MSSINDMRKFKPGWDGYDGTPPTKGALSAAETIMNLMSIATPIPGSDGSVQIDAYGFGWECEVHFNPEGKLSGIIIERVGL